MEKAKVYFTKILIIKKKALFFVNKYYFLLIKVKFRE